MGVAEDSKQGVCQRNTVAPATRQQISSVLIDTQKQAGHKVHIVTPITKKTRKQVGILFVDNTNLWEEPGEDDDKLLVLMKEQESINGWGKNLLVVGGELRPEECF